MAALSRSSLHTHKHRLETHKMLPKWYILTGGCSLSRNPPVNDPTPGFSRRRGRLQQEPLDSVLVSPAQSRRTFVGRAARSRHCERWLFPAQQSQTQEWKVTTTRAGFMLTQRLEFKPETFQSCFCFCFVSIYIKCILQIQAYFCLVPCSSIYNLTIIFRPAWLILGH